jgi:tetratricopeptide (TPR) repeat protein
MPHAYQKLNNCGPAAVAMAVNHFGGALTQFDAAAVLKGADTDKNVNPEEIVVYLESLNLRAVYRVGGTETRLKRLLASGIPVILHQWLVRPGDGELVGHYRVLRGYDDAAGQFITNDSYTGPDYRIGYDQFMAWWKPFNYGYIAVYPADLAEAAAQALGADQKSAANRQAALELALGDLEQAPDGYAHYNAGANYLALGHLDEAVSAFDQALEQDFPSHFLWYRFDHLQAYLDAGQATRVFALTDPVLRAAGELEELRYYRGRAYAQTGDTAAARQAFEQAIEANPRYRPAVEALEKLP